MSTQEGKPRSRKQKKQKGNASWIALIFFLSIVISSIFSVLSSTVLEGSGLVGAFFVLLLIVLVGIVFDIIGVAVMSAGEKPFHSMAAKKVPGATEALKLLRNAEKVSSVCNDVVGDICGIISGSAAAVIAATAFTAMGSDMLAKLLMSALVSALTIAGKAFGKKIAIKKATEIVYSVSKPIYYIKSLFRKKGKK